MVSIQNPKSKIPNTTDNGIVIREHRGWYDVETSSGVIACTIRSKLRKVLIYPESDNRRPTVDQVGRINAVSPVVIGDRVRIERTGDENAAIEEVLPRQTKLSRIAPGRRVMEHVIIANAEQLIIVFAVKDPTPNLRLLDRFLIAAELGGLTPILCLNKIDLRTPDLRDIGARYARIGYRVIETSAQTGEGIETLREILRGKLSAVSGPSGVGKSTLLNRLLPGLGLKVQEISVATGKGKHTTTALATYPLGGGGMVIDTPGIREFGLWELSVTELPTMFPEMRPFLGGCRFGWDCAHIHEPGCAVKDAVSAGEITTERYDGYCVLRNELIPKR